MCCFFFPAPTDDISDLGSEAEVDSQSASEPLVKRERSDPGPSLQEI